MSEQTMTQALEQLRPAIEAHRTRMIELNQQRAAGTTQRELYLGNQVRVFALTTRAAERVATEHGLDFEQLRAEVLRQVDPMATWRLGEK